MFQSPVGHMHDLIDRERRGRTIRVGPVVRVKLFGDHRQPLIELAFRPRIQRRESADDARLALRQRQLRVRNDE